MTWLSERQREGALAVQEEGARRAAQAKQWRKEEAMAKKSPQGDIRRKAIDADALDYGLSEVQSAADGALEAMGAALDRDAQRRRMEADNRADMSMGQRFRSVGGDRS